MADDDTPSKTLGMRVQGKIASKMSSKGLAKQVVDGPVSDIIDNCYRIAKTYLHDKQEAEKIMKNMIKIVVKLALLQRNNQFTREELVYVEDFQRKFQLICNSAIAFHNVDNTYDGDFMERLINESKDLLRLVVKNHLTEKSLNRIDHVYGLYSKRVLLDEVFDPSTVYRPYLTAIVTSLKILIDKGSL